MITFLKGKDSSEIKSLPWIILPKKGEEFYSMEEFSGDIYIYNTNKKFEGGYRLEKGKVIAELKKAQKKSKSRRAKRSFEDGDYEQLPTTLQ